MGWGLIAAAIAVVAFVRYRERESVTLTRQTELATKLRELAGDDDVRLAAVDEFETTIYQRLFFASVVAPWIRSAAWSLLATVLSGSGAIALGPLDGTFANSLYVVAIVATVLFGLATLAFVGLAAFHTATTPRVSFTDSYADYDEPEPAPARTAIPTRATSAADKKATDKKPADKKVPAED